MTEADPTTGGSDDDHGRKAILLLCKAQRAALQSRQLIALDFIDQAEREALKMEPPTGAVEPVAHVEGD